jgi:hypothetical protein
LNNWTIGHVVANDCTAFLGIFVSRETIKDKSRNFSLCLFHNVLKEIMKMCKQIEDKLS